MHSLRELQPVIGRNGGTVATGDDIEDNDDAAATPYVDGESDDEPGIAQTAAISFRLYAHGGKLWHVREQFVLPTDIPLRTAVRMWMEGMPGYQTVEQATTLAKAAPIRPFRLLKTKFLPTAVRAVYQLHWRPIMELFFGAPDITIPEGDPSTIATEEFDNIFEKGLKYLKEKRLSYVFKNRRKKPMEWKLPTWSRHAQPSSIEKGGEAIDISNLPPRSRNNAPRKTTTRKRKAKDASRRQQTPRNRPSQRNNNFASAGTHENSDLEQAAAAPDGDDSHSTNNQQQRRQPSQSNELQDDTSDEFAAAFGEIEMTEYMRQRDRQIAAEVAEETKETMEAEADFRQRVGDAVGIEGHALWIGRQPENRVPRNNGNVSNFERTTFQTRLRDLPNDGGDHYIA
jgi:hypothetical protein